MLTFTGAEADVCKAPEQPSKAIYVGEYIFLVIVLKQGLKFVIRKELLETASSKSRDFHLLEKLEKVWSGWLMQTWRPVFIDKLEAKN